MVTRRDNAETVTIFYKTLSLIEDVVKPRFVLDFCSYLVTDVGVVCLR